MKRLHRNEARSNRSVGKLSTMELIPNVMPILGTAYSGMGRNLIISNTMYKCYILSILKFKFKIYLHVKRRHNSLVKASMA